jgi:4-amino-4-deoxy-L-arabinose transferase-like glycosyltransferase
MNLKRFLPRENTTIALWLIIAAGFILRCWHMNAQSYWVDELHTMREADPDIPFSQLFAYLKCCDQHPPLYYFICRFSFTVFGHSEWVGRFISVIIGTTSIWAMWFLGKEIDGRRLGLIAAALTCFNYFNILYSQEVRNYILVFLFTALSFAYFFRLFRRLNKRTMFLYAIMTLLMMYSHYYGLFIAAAQFFVALLFILINPAERKIIFTRFAIAGLILAVGYAPWIPTFLTISKISSFWIGEIHDSFAKEFFYQYFGDSSLVLPFVMLLLIFYCLEVFKTNELRVLNDERRFYNPLTLSFVVFFTTTVIGYLIPYIRSILVVPMLYNRYTIVVVPAFLAVISFGLARINNAVVRNLLLVTIIVLSLIDLVLVKKFYTAVRKTQFREVTSYIASLARQEGKSYPIINQVTPWQQQYYIKRLGYKGEIWGGVKEDLVDSILRKSNPKYDVDGFWIVGFHGEGRLSPEKKAALDTAFIVVHDTAGYDAWGEFYLSKRASSGSRILGLQNFPQAGVFTEGDGRQVIPVWGGSISSSPIELKKGSYEMITDSRGTPFAGVFPHLKFYLNGRLVHDFFTGETYAQKMTKIEVPSDGSYELKIEMDNDASDPNLGDRNAFINKIMLIKK